MKTKSIGIIAVLVFAMMITSCKKEEEKTNTPEPTVNVYTDNNTYIDLDDIVVTLKNETPDTIRYGACNFSNVFDLQIEKKTDTAWTAVFSTLCVDYIWANLPGNLKISDTISADVIDPGDYRIKMKLIVNSNNTVLYSDEFNKK
jgi:hypothetical protein